MIPAERSHIHVAALSHPGMVGKNNEDRYAVSALRLSHENPLPVLFAIISDGVGGHRAGEVAAEIAVESISKQITNSEVSNPVKTLREVIIQASDEILEQSENIPEMKGMGATCACSWIIDDQFYVAYVGDSRIYFLRDHKITQVSIDHTWIQEALDTGLITPEEASGHPNAHIIRRYLGSSTQVEPDMRLHLSAGESPDEAEENQGLRLLPGDQILLCSDGLTDLVSDREILSAMEAESLDDALEQLIALANHRGGHDNITIVAMRVPGPIPQAGSAQPGARRWKFNLSCLVLGLITATSIILILAAYLLWNYGFPFPLPTPENTPTLQFIFESPESTPSIESTTTPQPVEPSATYQQTAGPTLTPWPVTPAATE